MNFYTSDQINSTRVVMDINGTIVFSAVYDPFGGILQTWTYDYDPVMKFSGKERDYESELDYFGARYYDHSHYRFTSVDPVINREEAFANPQLWNLYSYCRNNPLTFADPNGRDTINVFIGFKESDMQAYKNENTYNEVNVGKVFIEDLETFAKEGGHDLNIKRRGEFTSTDVVNSLKSGEDTWTFYIGHSVDFGDDGIYEGLGIDFNRKDYIHKSISSNNKYVGVFACSSNHYAFSLFKGPGVFAVDSWDDGSSAGGLAHGAYATLRGLIRGVSPLKAAEHGIWAQRYAINHQQDRWNDRIVYRK